MRYKHVILSMRVGNRGIATEKDKSPAGIGDGDQHRASERGGRPVRVCRKQSPASSCDAKAGSIVRPRRSPGAIEFLGMEQKYQILNQVKIPDGAGGIIALWAGGRGRT